MTSKTGLLGGRMKRRIFLKCLLGGAVWGAMFPSTSLAGISDDNALKPSDAIERIGYFDDNNGFFLEYNGVSLKTVIRSNGHDRVHHINLGVKPTPEIFNMKYNEYLKEASLKYAPGKGIIK